MNKIEKLIRSWHLDMTIAQVPDHPGWEPSHDVTFYHYHAIICNRIPSTNPNTLATYYSVGWGIVERWLIDQKKPVHIDGWGFIRPSELKKINKRLVSYQNMIAAAARRYKPTLNMIMTCLIQDAVSIDQSPLFEDWACDFGYDPDSRKAYKTFEIICEQRAKLIKIIGHSEYNKAIEIMSDGDWEDNIYPDPVEKPSGADSYTRGDGFTYVQYKGSDVVRFDDRSIMLRDHGYPSNDKRQAMNWASDHFGLGFVVTSDPLAHWSITYNGETIPYENGMIIDRVAPAQTDQGA